MDTRTKIIPLAEALRLASAESLPVIQLDADPLLSDILAQLPPAAVILIAERPDSYLSTQARAELASGLKAARYVACGESPAALDLRPAEAASRHALEQLVITKSTGSSPVA